MFNIEKLKEDLKGLMVEWNDLPSIDYFKEQIQGLDTLTYISELNNDNYEEFEIIGQIMINKVMVSIGKNSERPYEFLYLLKKKTDDKFKTLYVSLHYSNPIYWYRFKSSKTIKYELEKLYNLYSCDNIYDDYEEVFAYLGNKMMIHLNPRAVLSRLIITPFAEGFVWGSKYQDFPYDRNLFSELPIDKQYQIVNRAIEQEKDEYEFTPFSFSTRTMFSKSIIKFIENQGIYIGRFKYKSTGILNHGIKLLNEKFRKEYPLDFPVDLVIAIEYYPFITYEGILKKAEPQNLSTIITRLVPPEKKDIIKSISDKLDEMIREEQNSENPKLFNIEHYKNFRSHCLSSINGDDEDDDLYLYTFQKLKENRQEKIERHLDKRKQEIKEMIYLSLKDKNISLLASKGKE